MKKVNTVISKSFLCILFFLAIGCGKQPEPMAQKTPLPSAVEVMEVAESETVTNEIVQHKTFNQCDSGSSFRATIQFSQSDSQETQRELVLGLNAGGEAGISEMAKVVVEGAVEGHFANSQRSQGGHNEGVEIEVPAQTRQEYTIVWQENRRVGTVKYKENQEVKTVNYSYRIGLELVSATGRDIICPGQETVDVSKKLSPTSTPIPPTLKPTQTPVPPTLTPRPTNTPTPPPGGIGTTISDDKFQVTLAGYEYRSQANESDIGAVEFTLQFENKTTNEIPVVIDLWLLEGTDNLGVKYGEKYAVSARYSTFGFKGGWEEQLRNYEFIVPPNDVYLLTRELQVEGDYTEDTPTRVDIGTDWIDLVFPSIRYRTDELHSLFSSTWRLER